MWSLWLLWGMLALSHALSSPTPGCVCVDFWLCDDLGKVNSEKVEITTQRHIPCEDKLQVCCHTVESTFAPDESFSESLKGTFNRTQSPMAESEEGTNKGAMAGCSRMFYVYQSLTMVVFLLMMGSATR